MNRNTLWATTFVDELARNGLRAVCAAPGSRHTPLMLAFAKHPDIRVYSHLDERSAAFFALGLALASDIPVATICTSGTAGANMYPAIIEAHESRVPLIVITADRPHELRASGANQTIDQTKMFSDFVLWAVDTALPEATPPAIVYRNLRTLAARAMATANGAKRGVVHINMPFRKPLEPTPVESDVTEIPQGAEARQSSFVWIDGGQLVPKELNNAVSWLRNVVQQNADGVIIAGGHVANDGEGAILKRLAKNIGYPLLAESYSHTRNNEVAIGGYDSFIANAPKPSVILRFGDIPISKALNTYINTSDAEYIIHLSADGTWSDDAHLTHFLIPLSLENTAIALEGLERPPSSLYQQFHKLEDVTWQTIEYELDFGAYFDGGVVYDTLNLIPDGATIFAGNSLAVRHVDQFGKPQNKPLFIYANRGVSGIDGNLSTALGTGAARNNSSLVAIVGDITFYHDMNGLLAIHRCGVPITIVLLNNDGGGIFNRLPINKFEPEFTEYFITAHGLDFSHTAALYSIEHVRINVADEGARQSFREIFADKVHQKTSTIIEVMSDSLDDEQRRQEILDSIKATIQQIS